MSAEPHPDDATLGQFVLGRLDRETLARVGAHLRSCSRCEQVAIKAPDDRLVALLRASLPGFPAKPPSQASSPRELTGRRELLAVLVCFAGASVCGCFRDSGSADLSPEARATAKEAIKKKFQGYARRDRKTSP